MKSTKSYYKVINLFNKSCIVYGDATVRYFRNKFVSAPKYLAKEGFHLLVFDNIENARDFVKASCKDATEIWHASVKDEVSLPLRVPFPYVISRIMFKTVKENLGWEKIVYIKERKWPVGTRMFKKVKLIKEVNEMEGKNMLIGSSFYQGITAGIESYDNFLKKLVNNGLNCSELFFKFTWQGGWEWQPYLLVGQWKEFSENGQNWFRAEWVELGGVEKSYQREMAHDEFPSFPNHWFPLFDLERLSPDIISKWDQIFKLFIKHDLTMILRMQDFCSIKDGWEKRHYAFRSNLQRLVLGTFNGGLWGKDAYNKWYPQFIEILLQLIRNNPKIKIMVAPMNEADYIQDSTDTEESRDNKVLEFHDWHIKVLTASSILDKSQIILCPGRALEKHVALGCPIELHGIASPQKLVWACGWANTNNAIVFPNGDGPDPDARGYADIKGKRSPSVEQAREMGQMMKANERRLLGYSEFNRSTETTILGNVDRALLNHMRAMAETLGWRPEERIAYKVCKVTGLLPVDYFCETEIKEMVVSELPTQICAECIKHYEAVIVCKETFLLPKNNFCEVTAKFFHKSNLPKIQCKFCETKFVIANLCIETQRLASEYCKEVKPILQKSSDQKKRCLQHYPAVHWLKRLDIRRWWIKLMGRIVPD